MVDGSARVDVNRLARAWNELAKRHAVLRTVFVPSVTRKGTSTKFSLTKQSRKPRFLSVRRSMMLCELSGIRIQLTASLQNLPIDSSFAH